jgi:hypothetical protein
VTIQPEGQHKGEDKDNSGNDDTQHFNLLSAFSSFYRKNTPGEGLEKRKNRRLTFQ